MSALCVICNMLDRDFCPQEAFHLHQEVTLANSSLARHNSRVFDSKCIAFLLAFETFHCPLHRCTQCVNRRIFSKTCAARHGILYWKLHCDTRSLILFSYGSRLGWNSPAVFPTGHCIPCSVDEVDCFLVHLSVLCFCVPVYTCSHLTQSFMFHGSK